VLPNAPSTSLVNCWIPLPKVVEMDVPKTLGNNKALAILSGDELAVRKLAR